MDILLKTKLAPPIIRDSLVTRTRLYQRLDDGLQTPNGFQRKLTLVAAPAGSGKTTLVAGWLAASGQPFAWLSLDAADNDPNRFLAYLVKAASQFAPGAAAWQMLQSPQPLPWEAVLPVLLNEIAASPPFSLVLDDYHAIHTPQIHKLLEFFLDHQPASVHLVLASREDPPLPIPRLRARGQALEIRQNDLRFSPEESGAFLRQVMKLELSYQDVAALERRTEGWVAGLQLAALSISGSADPHGFIQAFAGSSRHVIDYLVSEVFEQQPGEVQEFLLKTSVLERMTAGLCDEVTGRQDSQALLEHLELANLFILPLDEEREWYRYHHLFAEFLRHHLRTRPGYSSASLHQAASRWYARHDLIGDAIEHALAAPDWAQAAALTGQATDAMLRAGQIVTLLGWYGRLPEPVLRSNTALCLAYAWPLILSSQMEKADAVLGWAEPSIRPGTLDEGNLYAARAYLARSRGDHAAVIHASERALDLLQEANPSVASTLSVNLGIAYWHKGMLDETEQVMSGAQRDALQTGNRYGALTAWFFRVRALASRGRLRQAEAQYQQIIREHGRTPIAALAYYDLATISLEWNRLEEAAQYLEQGMTISAQTANAEFLSSGHLLRALISLARGNPRAAQEDIARASSPAGVPGGGQARAAAARVLAALALGDLDQAARAADETPAGVDAHPLYRFLDLTHPRLLLARGEKAAASALLERGCEDARRQGWGYGLIAALVLRSLAARAAEDAVEYLSDALRLAEPDGYLRTFVDAGEQLAPVVREAARRGVCPGYAGHILAVMGAASLVTAAGLVEPLSARELEVLRLVSAGLSNREIARALTVTPGTVKTHIHNICAKLEVRNRTEAAARARELKLA